jgi:hypothetical protein
MRKFIIISVIAVHLLGNTELSQLIKLPNLLHHFLQHHRQNEAISFSEFLDMHYGGDDGTDADDAEDNKLPCHGINNNTLNVVYSFLTHEAADTSMLNHTGIVYGSRLLTYIPQPHLFSFFQPPRLA